MSQNPSPETRVPTPDFRNLEHPTIDTKPDALNPEPAIRCTTPETRNNQAGWKTRMAMRLFHVPTLV